MVVSRGRKGVVVAGQRGSPQKGTSSWRPVPRPYYIPCECDDVIPFSSHEPVSIVQSLELDGYIRW